MLAVMLAIPFAMFISACGATPSNEVQGAFFQSNKYDKETGYAIFEVDLNVQKRLTYKVNPSTWSGYMVRFNYKSSATNIEFYNMIEIDGVKGAAIEVTSEKFESFPIELYMGNTYCDTCIVMLKQYPNRIYVNETDVYLSASGLYSIKPIGVYYTQGESGLTESHEVVLSQQEFDFSLTTSDETKIQLIDKNRLQVFAVSKTPNDKAIVTLHLLDTAGNPKQCRSEEGEVLEETMTAIIDFTIIPNASSAVIRIKGEPKFFEDTDDSRTFLRQSVGGQAVVEFEIFFFSENDLFIDSKDIKLTIVVDPNDEDKIIVDSEGKKITVKSESDLDIKVTVTANVYDEKGSPFSVNFVFRYDFNN